MERKKNEKMELKMKRRQEKEEKTFKCFSEENFYQENYRKDIKYFDVRL